MPVLESAIERKVCRDAERRYGIRNIKLNGRGQTGWPDRMFIFRSGGRVVFVEFKRPGGKLSPRQRVAIDLLQEAGHVVIVAETYDYVMGCLEAMIGNE